MDQLIKYLPGKHWVLSVIPSSNIKSWATAVHVYKPSTGAWGGRHSRILGPSCPVSLGKSLSSLSQNTWRSATEEDFQF